MVDFIKQNISYILSNILFTYSIYGYFNIIYDERLSKKSIEMFSYFFSYIVATVFSIILGIGIGFEVFMFLLILLLTLNYRTTIIESLFVSISVFIAFIIIDLLIRIIFKSISFFEIFSSIKLTEDFIIILSGIFMLLAVLLLQKIYSGRFIKENIDLHFANLVVIPVSLNYIFLKLCAKFEKFSLFELVILLIVIVINIVALNLYYKTIVNNDEKFDLQMLKEQNEYYKNELFLINSEIERMQKFKHDLKNYLIVQSAMPKDLGGKVYSEYLGEILAELDNNVIYAKTGNLDLDSIINYKLSAISEIGAKIDVEINVPDNLAVSSFMITTILGNLLDNAKTALENLVGNKYLNLKIEYSKGILMIYIRNSIGKDVIVNNGKLMSSKRGYGEHGVGLQSVKNEVKRYGGKIDVSFDENFFRVFITINANAKKTF